MAVPMNAHPVLFSSLRVGLVAVSMDLELGRSRLNGRLGLARCSFDCAAKHCNKEEKQDGERPPACKAQIS